MPEEIIITLMRTRRGVSRKLQSDLSKVLQKSSTQFVRQLSNAMSNSKLVKLSYFLYKRQGIHAYLLPRTLIVTAFIYWFMLMTLLWLV